MFGKNSVFVILGLAGLACGFGMRWLVLPKGDAKISAVTEVVGVPTVARDLKEAQVPMPTLDEIEAAEGAAQRRLLVGYLQGAELGDVKALVLTIREGELKGLGRQIDLIYLRALELDGAGFVTWIKEMDGEKEHFRHSLANIYSLWMKVDLEAALKASESEEEYVRKSVIRELGREDVARAIALLKKEWPGDDMLAEMEATGMKELATDDPVSALTETLETTPKHKLRDKVNPLLSAWANKDPEAAWAWLSEQKGLDASNRLAGTVLLAMAEKDLNAAKEKLALLPENTGRMKIEGELLAKLSQSDVEGAMQSVLGEKNKYRRDYLFSKIAAKLMADDPKRFLDMVKENGISLGNDLIDSFEMDAKGHGWSQGGGESVSDLMGKAAIQWAREDPRGALLNLATLDISAMRNTIESVGKMWAGKDAKAASDWVATLPPGAFRNKVQSAVVEAWMAGEPQSALNWLKEISPDSIPETLRTIAMREPENAAQFIDSFATPEQRSEGIGNIAYNWRRIDPGGATQWLGGISTTDDVSVPLHEAAKEWVLKKPEEASVWISEMEAGVGKDHAVAGMVHALVSSTNPQMDFEAATVWVRTIRDAETRMKWEREITSRLAKGNNH